MKRIFILLILSLTIQNSFGQACGIYRIKYIGNIKSESLKVEKIKLPTIQFLHGLEDENSEIGFIEIAPIANEIDVELGSHLISHLYSESEYLLKFYKSNRENIPIIIITKKNGLLQEIRREVSWDNIQITVLKDDNFGKIFELNLSEIEI